MVEVSFAKPFDCSTLTQRLPKTCRKAEPHREIATSANRKCLSSKFINEHIYQMHTFELGNVWNAYIVFLMSVCITGAGCAVETSAQQR